MTEINTLSNVDCSFNILASAGREEMEMMHFLLINYCITILQLIFD